MEQYKEGRNKKSESEDEYSDSGEDTLILEKFEHVLELIETKNTDLFGSCLYSLGNYLIKNDYQKNLSRIPIVYLQKINVFILETQNLDYFNYFCLILYAIIKKDRFYYIFIESDNIFDEIHSFLDIATISGDTNYVFSLISFCLQEENELAVEKFPLDYFLFLINERKIEFNKDLLYCINYLINNTLIDKDALNNIFDYICKCLILFKNEKSHSIISVALKIINCLVTKDIITNEAAEQYDLQNMITFILNKHFRHEKIVILCATIIGNLANRGIFIEVDTQFIIEYIENNYENDSAASVLWMTDMILKNEKFREVFIKNECVEFFCSLYCNASFSIMQRIVLIFLRLIREAEEYSFDCILNTDMLECVFEIVSEENVKLTTNCIVSIAIFIKKLSEERTEAFREVTCDFLTQSLIEDIEDISNDEEFVQSINEIKDFLEED